MKRCIINISMYLGWFVALAQPNTYVEQSLLDGGIRIETFDFARDEKDVFDPSVLKWRAMLWTEALDIRAWERQWFRFKLTNTSSKAFEGILTTPHAHWITAFVYESGGIGKIAQYEAGSFTDFDKRAFALSPRAIPIVISGGEQQVVLVGLKTYEKPKLDSLHWLIKSKETVIAEYYRGKAGSYVNSGYYIAIFIMIAIVFSILFFTTRDSSIGWYALYVWGIFLFYFRKYEIRPGEPSLLSRYASIHLHTEIIFLLIVFIAYTGFIRSFFNTMNRAPRIDFYLKSFMVIFTCLIPVELMVIWLWGIQAGFELFTGVKTIGFLVFIIIGFKQMRHIRSESGKFILLGIFFLIAPAVFVMITRHIIGGKVYEVVYNVLQVVEIGSIKLPMYSMKLGVVFELLCFIFAIGHKVRLERDEKNQNRQEIERLGAQFQASKAILKKQEYLNKALLRETQDKQPSQFLVQVIEIIESNISNVHFGVEQLAADIYMSRAHLHRKLTEETGYSPSQLILRTRLHSAVELLKTTRLTIGEIAEKTGFSEPGYFAKVFKKELGYKPSEVRQRRNTADEEGKSDEFIEK